MRIYFKKSLILELSCLSAHSFSGVRGGAGGGKRGERGVCCVPWAVNSGGMMFRVDSHSVEDELVGGSSS